MTNVKRSVIIAVVAPLLAAGAVAAAIAPAGANSSCAAGGCWYLVTVSNKTAAIGPAGPHHPVLFGVHIRASSPSAASDVARRSCPGKPAAPPCSDRQYAAMVVAAPS